MPARQETFELLPSKFKKETMLQYFDMGKQTYLLVDAHQTDLGAMIAQGPNINTARLKKKVKVKVFYLPVKAAGDTPLAKLNKGRPPTFRHHAKW